MAEEATPERPVGCLGLPMPLTAPTPRALGPAEEPLAPAMDGPAGSAKPLDDPEHRERATAPSDTTPEAGSAPASDQITTRAQISPRASSSTSITAGWEQAAQDRRVGNKHQEIGQQ